jgi:hypothetical protein
VGLTAAFVLSGLPRAHADLVFTGTSSLGSVSMLAGLGPVPANSVDMVPNPTWTAQSDGSITLNTVPSTGQYLLEFGVKLGNTSLPIDVASLFAPPATAGGVGTFNLTDNKQNPLFTVKYDLEAPGSLAIVNANYPVVPSPSGFDTAGQVFFVQLQPDAGVPSFNFQLTDFSTGAVIPLSGPSGGDGTQDSPEPGTLTLFGTGLLGMLGYGWRRRRTTRRA